MTLGAGYDVVSPSGTTSVYRLVYRRELDGDPHNMRSRLTRLDSLADSIARHGLLENLVVRELSDDERPEGSPVWLQIKAGSRRLAAIDLLIDRGLWDAETQPIPIAVVEGDGAWEHLVENLQRCDVTPWDIGRRLAEFQSAGLSHEEIGVRIGRSIGWVSRYIVIGRGLSPEAIEWIQATRAVVPVALLFRVAAIVNEFNEPDGKAQVAALKMRNRRSRPQRRGKNDLRAFAKRISHLQDTMPIPPLLRPTVAAVLAYLQCGDRINFAALEDRLRGTVVVFRSDDDEEDAAPVAG